MPKILENGQIRDMTDDEILKKVISYAKII